MAASANQTWPPSERRSLNTRTPNTPAANAIAGNTRTTAQSSGWAEPRSRHNAGTHGDGHSCVCGCERYQRHAVQHHRLGCVGHSAPLIAVAWYSAGAVRALLVKMGLSAYFAPGRRWSSVNGTGRCEPRRAFLAICRGERSREARCDDPPSSGPCRFRGSMPRKRRNSVPNRVRPARRGYPDRRW